VQEGWFQDLEIFKEKKLKDEEKLENQYTKIHITIEEKVCKWKEENL